MKNLLGINVEKVGLEVSSDMKEFLNPFATIAIVYSDNIYITEDESETNKTIKPQHIFEDVVINASLRSLLKLQTDLAGLIEKMAVVESNTAALNEIVSLVK